MLTSHHVVLLELEILLANAAAHAEEVFRENAPIDQAIIASPSRSAIDIVQSGTVNGLKKEAEAPRVNVAGTLAEELGMLECQIA